MQTVVHVTHEAIQKIGGIGAVLHGLLTSKVYLEKAKIGQFKFDLWKNFAIDSSKYDSNNWDYEQWVRLAKPAVAALVALGAASSSEPCVMLSHEYMGMPTVLAAIMEGERNNFRT